MIRTAILFPLVLAAAPEPPKLTILRASFHDRQDGAAALPAGYQFAAGELLHFSFRVGGYAVVKDKVELRYQVVATDPQGVLLVPPLAGGVQEEVSFNDKDWLPRVQLTIPLPPQLPGGTCRLRVRVFDELGKRDAETTLEFPTRGGRVPLTADLAAGSLRFYASEDAAVPLDPPAYKQGDTVWLRFAITGFKLGEKNAFSVDYGLAVYRPSGQLLYEQPLAASEQEAPFYPKRYLVGGFSLNLSDDLTPGEYALAVKVRDKLRSAEAESRTSFTVLRK